MKKGVWLSIIFTLILCCFFSTSAFAVRILHDDFSGNYLDNQKWDGSDLVRKIDAGKLLLKIGNSAEVGFFRNSIFFPKPEGITSIECSISVDVNTINAGGGIVSFARIGGFFYNMKTKTSEGPTGDIWAEIQLGDRGNGLEAFWVVEQVLNDDDSDRETLEEGTLIEPGELKTGTAYTVKLSYNGGKKIVFTVDGQSNSVTGPARIRAAVNQDKALAVGIDTVDSSGRGIVSAEIDDVVINNLATPYDSFDKAPLDPAKWIGQEIIREISKGKLNLNVQGCNQDNNIGLSIIPYDTRYFEAKVLIDADSQVPVGDLGFALIGGMYYNDSRGPGSGKGYNGYTGNVWVNNQIMLNSDGELQAIAEVWRSEDSAAELDGKNLLWQEFSLPIAFDTEYTLSIEFKDSRITFKCDNETIVYDVKTPIYPAFEEVMYLNSNLSADPGECGYMKAQFDDVHNNPDGAIDDFVTRFYELCLGRSPDTPGLVGWVTALLDGSLTGSDVGFGFVFSSEFLAKNTSDEEYLQILYEAFFNRQPDAAGLQGWLDAIKNGATREDVLNGYIFAKEFEELCEKFGIRAYDGHATKDQRELVEAFVTRFYQLCLDRDPDAAGLKLWADNLINQIQTGAEVATGFIYSPEFIAKNTSNAQYLEILYKAFFDREADQGGWDAWIEALENGRDRGDILNGFIYSQEFGELAKRFGIKAFN